MELAIRTEHLTKIYNERLIAVNDMNLEVPRGSVFGLLGLCVRVVAQPDVGHYYAGARPHRILAMRPG